jgi:hypothetical protein
MLKNKIAVVTDADTEIGRKIAVECAKEGATVISVAKSLGGLNETVKNVKRSSKGTGYCIDLRKTETAQSFSKEIKKKHGRVDILVNIAGIPSLEYYFYGERERVTQMIM